MRDKILKDLIEINTINDLENKKMGDLFQPMIMKDLHILIRKTDTGRS